MRKHTFRVKYMGGDIGPKIDIPQHLECLYNYDFEEDFPQLYNKYVRALRLYIMGNYKYKSEFIMREVELFIGDDLYEVFEI